VLRARPVWLDFVEYQYLERSRWVQPEDVVSALVAALRDAGATSVFAPFGLANPDHVCTHRAAMLAREHLQELAWFCYEDTGYKSIPGALAHRISKMRGRGTWATPTALEVPNGYAARAAAMGHYPSQLRALEQEWNLAARLEAPTPEQYWELGPRVENMEDWLESS
jgi:LmbE family N-acetylglucosaminyl deacetylase